MAAFDGSIQRLIEAFAKLPSIGPKGATRLAFHVLSSPRQEAQELAEALIAVKDNVRFCEICGNVCETSPCPICVDSRRDRSTICVVADPRVVMSIERTGEYRGLYHVLGGTINPMANVSAADLRIAQLLERLQNPEVKELIFALNQDVEGEATVTYISRLLAQVDIQITQLASGLPVGSDLEYADDITLGHALSGRRSLH
ncbi:MAG: recombination mediator RecR [Bifidobacteriaceae bacterium]|nr:recombination mediator RecR [Bifidobacteriaceae bacterium]